MTLRLRDEMTEEERIEEERQELAKDWDRWVSKHFIVVAFTSLVILAMVGFIIAGREGLLAVIILLIISCFVVPILIDRMGIGFVVIYLILNLTIGILNYHIAIIWGTLNFTLVLIVLVFGYLPEIIFKIADLIFEIREAKKSTIAMILLTTILLIAMILYTISTSSPSPPPEPAHVIEIPIDLIGIVLVVVAMIVFPVAKKVGSVVILLIGALMIIGIVAETFSHAFVEIAKVLGAIGYFIVILMMLLTPPIIKCCCRK